MNLTRIWNFSRVGVCQLLHFVESEYELGGTVLKGNIRIRRKFRSDSVPSVFTNIPKYLQKTFPKPRKTERVPPSVRQDKLKTKFIKSEMAGEFLLCVQWPRMLPKLYKDFSKLSISSCHHGAGSRGSPTLQRCAESAGFNIKTLKVNNHKVNQNFISENATKT